MERGEVRVRYRTVPGTIRTCTKYQEPRPKTTLLHYEYGVWGSCTVPDTVPGIVHYLLFATVFAANFQSNNVVTVLSILHHELFASTLFLGAPTILFCPSLSDSEVNSISVYRSPWLESSVHGMHTLAFVTDGCFVFSVGAARVFLLFFDLRCMLGLQWHTSHIYSRTGLSASMHSQRPRTIRNIVRKGHSDTGRNDGTFVLSVS